MFESSTSLIQGLDFLNKSDIEKQKHMSKIEPFTNTNNNDIHIIEKSENKIVKEERVVDDREKYLKELQNDFNTTLSEYSTKYRYFMEQMKDIKNENKEEIAKRRTENMKKYAKGVYVSSEYDDWFSKQSIYGYPNDIRRRSWLTTKEGYNFKSDGVYIGKEESNLSGQRIKGPWIEFRIVEHPKIDGLYILGPYPDLNNTDATRWYNYGTPRDIEIYGAKKDREGRWEWSRIGAYYIPENAQVTKTDQEPYYISFDKEIIGYEYIRIIITRNRGNSTWSGLSLLEFSFLDTSSDWNELNELNNRLLKLANDIEYEYNRTVGDERYIQDEINIQKEQLRNQVKDLEDKKNNLYEVETHLNTLSGADRFSQEQVKFNKYSYIGWIVLIGVILLLIVISSFVGNTIVSFVFIGVAILMIIIASVSFGIKITKKI